MYVLKHLPEDFVVEEIANPRLADSGRFLIARVTKRSRNSEEVAALLAQQLRIPRRAVGYAGSKDRNALTSQLFSLEGVRKEEALALSLRDVSIEPLGCSQEPLGLGALEGNRFTIMVRNLEGGEDLSLPASAPNYFDEQRFSTHNAIIGEAIVRKEFRRALELVRESGAPEYAPCADFLAEHPSEPAVAITRLPKMLLKLYLHAYQSLLWNRALAKYVAVSSGTSGGADNGTRTVSYSLGKLVFPKKGTRIDDAMIPIPGFEMETDNAAIRQALDAVMAEARLSPRDFVIRQLPNLSLEGAPRSALMRVSEYSFSSFADDEHFPGRKKAVLRFTLGKGSYATMLVRAVLAEGRDA